MRHIPPGGLGRWVRECTAGAEVPSMFLGQAGG